MTRDQIGSDSPPAGMDDDRLADLVRAAATDWTMPPQRLDHTTWRDRVVVSRPRRARGRVPRLAIPLAGAVAVTVALAFTAVWLDGSRRSAVTGASPSPTGTSAATSRPTASDGKAIVNGALPDPASVLVAAGEDYRVADLSAGRLGPDVFGRHSGPKTVVARPGGGWLCVCGDWDGSDRSGPPSRLTVTLATADATGLLQSETTIRQTVGRVDPALPSAAQEELVDGHATISPDGRFAFLGWSVRDGADWKLGIDVIDVAAGRLIGSSGLPNLRSVTDDGQPVTRAAPDVALAPSTGSVLVSDLWFVGGEQESPPSGVDHWSASFDGSSIAALGATRATQAATCQELAAGPVDEKAWWDVCSAKGTLRFDRVAVDGTLVGSTPLPPFDGLSTSLVDPSGKVLYMWGPTAMTLARIDVASGTVASVTGKVAAAGDPMSDMAGAIGRWIAPRAAAKIIVDPGLVLSPDGTRVYALGADLGNGEAVASQGVFVFDAATLEQIGHWAPSADLTSIAVSPDGAWLYAAGQPGFDASGAATGDASSVTVYATRDGSVRLTAGRLGHEAISFPRPSVP